MDSGANMIDYIEDELFNTPVKIILNDGKAAFGIIDGESTVASFDCVSFVHYGHIEQARHRTIDIQMCRIKSIEHMTYIDSTWGDDIDRRPPPEQP
jgi:hypothetical protein